MSVNKYPERSKLSIEIWLSLATTPFLLLLLAAAALYEKSIDLGLALEEIFRGDRLPVLNFPPASEKENQ